MKKQTHTMKIIFGTILGSLVGIFLSVIAAQGVHTNTIGWFWGGTTDASLDILAGGPGPQTTTGVGWVSVTGHELPCIPAVGPTNPNCYGIDVPLANGAVTGYAWSPNVGWINFQPAGPFPSSICNPGPCPNHAVRRTGDDLEGWARIVGVTQTPFPGQYTGWIKMRGNASNGQPYGVSIAPGATTPGFTDRLEGFAWSDEFGFVYFGSGPDNPPFPQFAGIAGPPPPPPVVPPPPPPPQACGDTFPQCNGTCSGGQICQVSGGSCNCVSPSLAVTCTGSPSSGRKITWGANSLGGTPPYIVSWDFTSDPGAIPQSAGNANPILVTYATNGNKTAQVTVTDGAGGTDAGTCAATAVQFKLFEDIPSFF